ncbi:hypothetical protein [Bradyrhizobium sp. CCBAU 45384]|uniref:hypothetical protein n=1 Tax=Bradyrhizobium sp. CCBAU 45384 TaxID=858428 RepID=UPI00230650D3|nr:hypothetical protein [Bradyrhizobium sp. CCBAU 45384]
MPRETHLFSITALRKPEITRQQRQLPLGSIDGEEASPRNKAEEVRGHGAALPRNKSDGFRKGSTRPAGCIPLQRLSNGAPASRLQRLSNSARRIPNLGHCHRNSSIQSCFDGVLHSVSDCAFMNLDIGYVFRFANSAQGSSVQIFPLRYVGGDQTMDQQDEQTGTEYGEN